MLAAIVLSVIVATWNGNWFPSGRAEHRAPEEVERERIDAAGKMFRSALAKLDPTGSEDVVICLCEMRGPKAVRALASSIGRTNLTMASISGYRRRDRYDMQQNAILTTLPVVDAGWSCWRKHHEATPPRGYAMANLVFPGMVTGAVFAVHLKSDYGATTAEARALASSKRMNSIADLLSICDKVKAKSMPIIVAGDFNEDQRHAKGAYLKLLDNGFDSAIKTMAADAQITHPGRGKWGDSALDGIFFKGLNALSPAVVGPACKVSDHLPLLIGLE